MGRAGAWRTYSFRSADGLTLQARDYGPQDGRLLPVLCLPGLTRNAKDFHDLAIRLSSSRRVIAPDYRGRGRSEYADWKTYRADVELSDALLLLDGLKIAQAVFVGTSRGGIVAMLAAAAHRDRLAGVLLNDIGPVLEREGLLRIAGYLGKGPDGLSWEGAVDMLKRTQSGFESLSDSEWLDFARRLYRDEGGRPALDYDPNLARAFPTVEQLTQAPLPDMWAQFKALDGLPVAALRGENSDLLSESTFLRMAETVRGLDAVTVSGRGHAPFLDEPESLAAIDRLLARTS